MTIKSLIFEGALFLFDLCLAVKSQRPIAFFCAGFVAGIWVFMIVSYVRDR